MSKMRSSLGEKCEKTTLRGRRTCRQARRAGRAEVSRVPTTFRWQAPQWEG